MTIPNPYFSNVPCIGDLEIDYIIVENECPIVFICKDRNNDLYFCNCVTMQNVQKWAITKISKETIMNYFKNEISNYEIFKNSSHKIYIVTWNFGYKKENNKIVSSDKVLDDDLPPRDSYLYADEGEFDDYIELLENRDSFSSSLKIEQLILTDNLSQVVEKTLDFTDDFTSYSHKNDSGIKYNSDVVLSKHFMSSRTRKSLSSNVSYSSTEFSYVSNDLKYAS